MFGSKLQKLALLLALIFLVSGVTAGVLYGVKRGPQKTPSWNLDFNFGNSKSPIKGGTNVDEVKTTALKGLESISVEDVSDDINLIRSDTDEVKAHFSGSYYSSDPDYKPQLVFDRSGNSLKIKIQYNPGILVFNFRSDLKLDVTIPEKYAADLAVKSTSADIKADEMALRDFTCNTVSGNLTAEKVQAKKAELGTTSGDITINGTFDEFHFNSISGNLTSDSFTSKTSKLGTTSGDVELTGAPGDVTANTVSGEISLAYDEYSNKINANSTSGDFNIKLPSDAGFKLDYKTTSGDEQCSFPITLTGKKDEHHVQGTVGDGTGAITVSTVSGNLEIDE